MAEGHEARGGGGEATNSKICCLAEVDGVDLHSALCHCADSKTATWKLGSRVGGQ